MGSTPSGGLCGVIADALSSGPGPAGTASTVTAPVQGGRARKGLWGASRVGDPPCGGHRSGSRGKKQELHTHEDTPTERCSQVHPPRSPWRDLTKRDNTTSRSSTREDCPTQASPRWTTPQPPSKLWAARCRPQQRCCRRTNPHMTTFRSRSAGFPRGEVHPRRIPPCEEV